MIASWYLIVMMSWYDSSLSSLKIPMATRQDCEVAANMIRDRAGATAVCVPTGYGEKK